MIWMMYLWKKKILSLSHTSTCANKLPSSSSSTTTKKKRKNEKCCMNLIYIQMFVDFFFHLRILKKKVFITFPACCNYYLWIDLVSHLFPSAHILSLYCRQWNRGHSLCCRRLLFYKYYYYLIPFLFIKLYHCDEANKKKGFAPFAVKEIYLVSQTGNIFFQKNCNFISIIVCKPWTQNDF